MKRWRIGPLAGGGCLFAALSGLFVVGAPPLVAQETSLISFELRDQFDEVHRDSDFVDRVVIVIGSDRDGSEFNQDWGQALYDSLVAEPEFERIAFLPVAKVTGVPFFLKGMVRGKFPKEPDQWALIDWDGVFDEAYGFVPGSTNILLFAPDGSLMLHSHGQEVDADVLEGVVSEARALLDHS